MSPQKESVYHLGSVPLVGHGNVFAIEALFREAQKNNIPFYVQHLKYTAPLAQIFHKWMTKKTDNHAYTAHPEVRTSPAALAFARLLFLEFAGEILAKRAGRTNEFPAQTKLIVHMCQEHQLLGCIPWILEQLNVEFARLLVPDSYPKTSAIDAMINNQAVSWVVWNKAAKKRLEEQGFGGRVILTRPFFDALLKSPDEQRGSGVPVVVKSSGSGMPKEWIMQLIKVFDSNNLRYSFHLPDEHYKNGQWCQHKQESTGQIADHFFHDLGDNTQLIVGYPSELVAVAMGTGKQFVSFSPRGLHEYENLTLLQDSGLLVGVLDFGDNALAHLDTSFPRCTVAELPGLINRLCSPPDVTHLLGEANYWDSI